MAGYPKATHCKDCGSEFTEELPKFGTHAKCEPCFRKTTRTKSGIHPKSFWENFNKDKRAEALKQTNNELKKMKNREEWLEYFHNKFDAIQIEIKLLHFC